MMYDNCDNMYYQTGYHRLMSENSSLRSENASLRAKIAALEIKLNSLGASIDEQVDRDAISIGDDIIDGIKSLKKELKL